MPKNYIVALWSNKKNNMTIKILLKIQFLFDFIIEVYAS